MIFVTHICHIQFTILNSFPTAITVCKTKFVFKLSGKTTLVLFSNQEQALVGKNDEIFFVRTSNYYLLFPFFLIFHRIALIIDIARMKIPTINTIKKNLQIKIWTFTDIFTNSFPFVPVICRTYKGGPRSLILSL